MDVEKGRTLATAFLSMEEMYKQQRQKVAAESEVIVKAAVNAATFTEMAAKEERKILVQLSYNLKDEYRKETGRVQSLNIDLIDNLVFGHEEMERRSLKSHKLLHEMTTKMCEYFAMKDVVHKQMNEIVVANPTLRKFAEMLSNPDKGSNNELLAIVSDIINNNGKTTGKQWSDSTKTLFALIMDFGGPALASQVRETMGGPSLTTLYKTVRLPYAIPQNIESPSFSRARAFFDRLGIQGPFILAVDATPVIPALKVRGNRIYGIAKDDVIVRTAEDIIKIAGDK